MDTGSGSVRVRWHRAQPVTLPPVCVVTGQQATGDVAKMYFDPRAFGEAPQWWQEIWSIGGRSERYAVELLVGRLPWYEHVSMPASTEVAARSRARLRNGMIALGGMYLAAVVGVLGAVSLLGQERQVAALALAVGLVVVCRTLYVYSVKLFHTSDVEARLEDDCYVLTKPHAAFAEAFAQWNPGVIEVRPFVTGPQGDGAAPDAGVPHAGPSAATSAVPIGGWQVGVGGVPHQQYGPAPANQAGAPRPTQLAKVANAVAWRHAHGDQVVLPDVCVVTGEPATRRVLCFFSANLGHDIGLLGRLIAGASGSRRVPVSAEGLRVYRHVVAVVVMGALVCAAGFCGVIAAFLAPKGLTALLVFGLAVLGLVGGGLLVTFAGRVVGFPLSDQDPGRSPSQASWLTLERVHPNFVVATMRANPPGTISGALNWQPVTNSPPGNPWQ